MRFGWGLLLFLFACSRTPPEPERQGSGTSAATTNAIPTTLKEARSGFVTKVTGDAPRGTPATTPPSGVFDLVRYPSPVGPLAAYVTPPKKDGKRRAAIVWIFGGFDNGIDATAWQPAPRENDQSARAFREAGIILMLPSLRGGNDNPGKRETFYGEVDDVIAARDWLAQQDGVDPERIYLGGHSTGGTLALLIAETTNKFRAVFAFGPVADAHSYGSDPPVLSDAREARVRSPVHFMATIRTPTFIIEGSTSANARDLTQLARAAGAAPVKTFKVEGADHFKVLAPITTLLARKMLTDTIELTDAELAAAMAQ
jgi:acetyl esterase/lipase